jgi:hypothetical protein
VEGLRNCKGTWHARHMHMTKQSQVTFHGHHFKAIMGFIMHGYAPRWVNTISKYYRIFSYWCLSRTCTSKNWVCAYTYFVFIIIWFSCYCSKHLTNVHCCNRDSLSSLC